MQSLPWLLTGAWPAVLVDRSDRRRLMVVVDVTRAVIIAGLAAAMIGLYPLWAGVTNLAGSPSGRAPIRHHSRGLRYRASSSS